MACRFLPRLCPLAVRVCLRISLRGRSHLGAILKQKPSKNWRPSTGSEPEWQMKSVTDRCARVSLWVCGRCCTLQCRLRNKAPGALHRDDIISLGWCLPRLSQDRQALGCWYVPWDSACPWQCCCSPQLLIAECCHKYLLKWVMLAFILLQI